MFLLPHLQVIKSLNEARGNGTSMISLVIPPKVGRCKLDPSLKVPCFQPLNLRGRTLFSVRTLFLSLRHYTKDQVRALELPAAPPAFDLSSGPDTM